MLPPDNPLNARVWVSCISHALVPARVSERQNCLVLLSLALWLCKEKTERPMPDKGTLEPLMSWGEMARSRQDQCGIHQAQAPEGAVKFCKCHCDF